MKIIIALGGNALGNNPVEQLNLIRNNAKFIVDLIKQGHNIVITHGNGPQVGMINASFAEANKDNSNIPSMPFPECNAMSQGYIGYHLQKGIKEELINQRISKSVTTIITQVVVDKNDTAFNNPTKPIGSFYTKEEIDKIKNETLYQYVEDSGRGYRRVVASPLPLDIVEKDVVSTLIDNGHIVITVGGGGIPVYKDGNKLVGIDAVIDKDYASSKLGELIEADYLVILTAVEKVAINYGKENEELLSELDIETVDKYIREGHFSPGSMLPKIVAAKNFVLSKKGRKALITSLDKAALGLSGKAGTVIK